MTKLAWFGIATTVIYLICVATIMKASWLEFIELGPNEWGDFLAGTLGPLGIFWLVLGYFQQGAELRHSVEALRLQAEELKNSVEQQKAMVGITEKQLSLDVEVREEQLKKSISQELPRFTVTSGGHGPSRRNQKHHRRFTFHAQNLGADAINGQYKAQSEIIDEGQAFRLVTTHQSIEMEFDVPYEVLKTWRAKLVIISKNIRDQERVQTFEIGNIQPKEISCEPSN